MNLVNINLGYALLVEKNSDSKRLLSAVVDTLNSITTSVKDFVSQGTVLDQLFSSPLLKFLLESLQTKLSEDSKEPFIALAL